MEKLKNREELNKFIGENLDNVKVVKMSAGWCSPCRALGNTIDSLTLKESECAEFREIDVDEVEEELLEEYSIRNIPVLLYFKNGLLSDKTVGLLTKEGLLNKIEEIKNK